MQNGIQMAKMNGSVLLKRSTCKKFFFSGKQETMQQSTPINALPPQQGEYDPMAQQMLKQILNEIDSTDAMDRQEHITRFNDQSMEDIPPSQPPPSLPKHIRNDDDDDESDDDDEKEDTFTDMIWKEARDPLLFASVFISLNLPFMTNSESSSERSLRKIMRSLYMPRRFPIISSRNHFAKK